MWKGTWRLIWQWILEKHNASKLCKFNVPPSPGIGAMREIVSRISRAPFPYSPQGDETIRYILYGVSRTFSSYCRILDSKGPFSSSIHALPRLRFANAFEIVPSQLQPSSSFFLSSPSSDFSRDNKQYSRVLARQPSFLWRFVTTKKKKKKKKGEKKFEENSHTFRIIRHPQTCKQRRNTCCCKFPCEFPQRELTRLFSYVMSPVWTLDTTVWFR